MMDNAEQKQKQEDLIPLERVLEDMHDDYNSYQSAARAYYYEHYASEQERVQMDFEDRISRFIAKVITVLFLSATGFAIVMAITEVINKH